MKNSNTISAKKAATILVAGFMTTAALAGLLDNAWLMGVTDKDPLTYKPGEDIVFTVTPKGLDGAVPDGKYFLEHLGTDLNIVGYKRFNHVERVEPMGVWGPCPQFLNFSTSTCLTITHGNLLCASRHSLELGLVASPWVAPTLKGRLRVSA